MTMVTDLPVRVLIVEDYKAFAEYITLCLTDAGCEIRYATSRGEAVYVLDEYRPHVAFIDLGIPPDSTGGFAVARWAAEHHPSTTIAILTGSHEPRHSLWANKLGAHYLMKDLMGPQGEALRAIVTAARDRVDAPR